MSRVKTSSNTLTDIGPLSTILDIPGDFNYLQGNVDTEVHAILQTKNGKKIEFRWPVKKTLDNQLFDISFSLNYTPETSTNIEPIEFSIHTTKKNNILFSGSLFFTREISIQFWDLQIDTSFLINMDSIQFEDNSNNHQIRLENLSYTHIFSDKLLPVKTQYSNPLILYKEIYTIPLIDEFSIVASQYEDNIQSYEYEVTKDVVLYTSGSIIYSLSTNYFSLKNAKHIASNNNDVRYILHHIERNVYYLTRDPVSSYESFNTEGGFVDIYKKNRRDDVAIPYSLIIDHKYNGENMDSNVSHMHNALSCYFINYGNIDSYILPTSLSFNIPFIFNKNTMYLLPRENKYTDPIHLFHDITSCLSTEFPFLKWNVTLFQNFYDSTNSTYVINNSSELQLFVLYEDLETDINMEYDENWTKVDMILYEEDLETEYDFIVGSEKRMFLYQYVGVVSDYIEVLIKNSCVFFTSPVIIDFVSQPLPNYHLYIKSNKPLPSTNSYTIYQINTLDLTT